MPNVIHILSSVREGGVEQGLQTLVQEGFYDVANEFRIIELVRGHGTYRNNLKKMMGDRMVTLIDRDEDFYISTKDFFALVKKLHHTFRAIKPDTIVLSHSLANIIGRCAAMAHRKIKVINFEHGTGKSSWLIRTLLKVTLWRADSTFGDSPETIKQRQPHYNIFKKPTHYVPLVVLKPGKVHGRMAPKLIKIVSLGQLATRKNYAELIHAIIQLIKKDHNIQLTIAGEGHQRPLLESIIQSAHENNPLLNLPNRITLPGFVGDKQTLNKLLASSDLYVQCSISEGFCIATAEALAAGLPTATTDFSGARDYGTESNIRLIEGTSRVEIEETLRDMIVNYGKIAPLMSTAALKTTKSSFSRQAVKEKWISGQQELLLPRHTHPYKHAPTVATNLYRPSSMPQ